MWKYKSVKTFERLTKIQPEEPKYEYSEIKEIDQKFQEFCDKALAQTFPESALIKQFQKSMKEQKKSDSQRKLESLGRRKNQSSQQIQSEIPNKQLQIIHEGEGGLTSLVDLQFKMQLHKNISSAEVNPIVKMFGSTLIATAFQCLVIKSLEETLKLKLNFEGEMPITTSVLRAFDINPNQLNMFKTQGEKQKYIIEQMNEVINSLLKSWQDKIYLKERKYKEKDNTYSQESKNTLRQKQYKWLNLKTKYEELRNKLRQIVVDKINDYENQTLAIDKLKEREDLKKNGLNPNHVKILLQNVKIVTTRHIFENMEKFGQSSEFHFLNSLGPDRQEKIKRRSEQIQNNQKAKPLPIAKQPQVDEPVKYDIEWKDEQEKLFMNQRSKTKFLFTNEVRSSNWNDLGFLPILQQLSLQEKKKVQRDHILNRYANGEWLTAQELQFLANTSTLLNSCLDRDFIQKTTNIIDNELLQNMELQLAEQILCDYEQMKIATAEARLKYIRDKMVLTKERIERKIQEERKTQANEENREFNQKFVKIFTTVIHHMERLGKFQEKIPDEIPGAFELHQFLIGKITQKELINKLIQLRNDKYFQELENAQGSSDAPRKKNPPKLNPQLDKKKRKEYFYSMSRPKSSLTTGFSKEVTRHYYHPSSKMFINANANDQDKESDGYNSNGYCNWFYFLAKLRETYNKMERDKFHLHLKSHPALKIQTNFQGFYSGGPPIQETPTQVFVRKQNDIMKAIDVHEQPAYRDGERAEGDNPDPEEAESSSKGEEAAATDPEPEEGTVLLLQGQLRVDSEHDRLGETGPVVAGDGASKADRKSEAGGEGEPRVGNAAGRGAEVGIERKQRRGETEDPAAKKNAKDEQVQVPAGESASKSQEREEPTDLGGSHPDHPDQHHPLHPIKQPLHQLHGLLLLQPEKLTQAEATLRRCVQRVSHHAPPKQGSLLLLRHQLLRLPRQHSLASRHQKRRPQIHPMALRPRSQPQYTECSRRHPPPLGIPKRQS